MTAISDFVLAGISNRIDCKISSASSELGRKWWFPFEKKYFFCSLCTSKVIPKEMSESRLMKYTLSQPKIFWLFNQYFETQRKIVRYWGTSKQQPTSTFTDCNLWNFASGRGLSSSTNPKDKTNGTKELKSRTLSLSFFLSGQYQLVHGWVRKCSPKNLHSKIVAFGTHLG